MLNFKSALAACAIALPFAVSAAEAADPVCEIDRPIVFAGLDWDSNSFHNSVAEFIMQNGYGCETDSIPGSTIPLLNGMARGDIDVTMEIWPDNVTEALAKGIKNKQFVDLGVNFPDATQAWYVPKYLVEGDDAPAKGLKSVSDLPKYKDVFSDPEEPEKGRFYNCIAGWGCEVINSKKLYGYKLTDSYVNFRPGTGAAMAAAIESNIRRKKPIIFYYWSPTWVMGKFGDDVVKLEEPAYNKEIWDELSAQTDPSKVTQAVAYPLSPTHVFVNTEFHEAAPKLVKFLTAYETTSSDVSKALAFMQDTGGTTADAAVNFLQNNQELWTGWVPADVAERVNVALKKQ
ncbi:Glycine betaine-binding periplasmic protein precursor [Pseudovibrio axinellae]|uniref:Glycine betaine-binding periplasmic protein n=1 Tax=Pseudovibrio axinellae TaxID=989403 RepID=A0A165X3A3_9HYPH|nr:ABC transporter substrate-binding protein [Pseudovibrio axinellae]KZL17307.1 Glycine betaine-binding periplasmic protein precursor [Pseudovibrio axinellae]SEQ19631.1 glycine betaine/proline transport system substrate-binding protein [Pseudovibrio axinellae]